MECTLYLFENKRNNKGVVYAYLDNIPFTIKFSEETNKTKRVIETEYLMREDTEAEKALAGKESTYELVHVEELNKNGNMYNALKECMDLNLSLAKNQKEMRDNKYDAFKSNKYNDYKYANPNPSYGGFQKNQTLESTISKNN